LLGDLIGQPIAVHEDLDSSKADRTPDLSPLAPDDETLRENPEVLAMINNHLQTHYQNSLDERIPMLDNLTPRECAANPKTRDKAINWLKNMELHNKKTGQPFDSTPLWESLNLTEYRTGQE